LREGGTEMVALGARDNVEGVASFLNTELTSGIGGDEAAGTVSISRLDARTATPPPTSSYRTDLSSYRSPHTSFSPASAHSPISPVFSIDPSPTPSPGHLRLSITPRNLNHRTRLSTSITPTALLHESYAYDDPPSTFDVDDGDDGDIQDGWGDEAVLEWTGGAGDRHQATDSASSVAAEDAGISEEEEDWGRDAQMEWAWSPTQANLALSEADVVSEDTDEEEIEEIDELEDYAPPASQAVVVESKEQLVARGMPDYDEWELKRLQVSGEAPPGSHTDDLTEALQFLWIPAFHEALGSGQNSHGLLVRAESAGACRVSGGICLVGGHPASHEEGES
jgi:hypothetical protein